MAFSHEIIWRSVVLQMQYIIQSNLYQAASQGKYIWWLLRTGGCFIKVKYVIKYQIGNLKICCLIQVACFTKGTINTGLTLYIYI